MKPVEVRIAASCLSKLSVAMLICIVPVAVLAQKKPAASAAKPAARPAAPAAHTAAPAGRGGGSVAGRGAASSSAGRGAGAGAAGRGAGVNTAGRGAGANAAGRGAGANTAGRGAGNMTGRGNNSPAGRGSGNTFGRGGNSNAMNHGGAGHPPPGGRTFNGRNGNRATFGAHGNVREVHARGMDIHHGPGGSRMVVRERADHVRIVSNHRGYGYIQHPYAYRGANFYHRTYYVNGVAYSRFYRPYTWGGVALNVYAPGMYYAPAFYGWAYNPWVTPVVYPWGWAGNPWYAYYGGWFTPYPSYATPSLWLTDYLVAQTLQAAYAEQAAAAQANALAGNPMTPDVKQAIADEVRRQIALENSEAKAGTQNVPDPGSSGIARMLSDNTPHVFVVSAGLDVPSEGQECPVTEGDVLQLILPVAPQASSVNMMVLASKGQDCRKGAVVTVGAADLQEMQNHMRETLDQGLGELQSKQGKNGLPAAPPQADAPPVKTAFAEIAPPPDPNVATELAAQTKEADQAEQEVLHEASSGPSDSQDGAASAPTTAIQNPAPAHKALSPGQTIDEVVGILGQPQDIVDVGEKKIYVFKTLKVTFVGGKATKFE